MLTTSRELTAQDRCDRCGAQARVVAKMLRGELYFCGHHARESGYKLVKAALTIWDPDEELKLL